MTSSRPFDAVRQSLASRVRVLAGGAGTVEAPAALWFEVTRRSALDGFPTLADLREALTPADSILGLQQVTEGDGKDLARQISLLSSCGEGLWRESVPGGVEKRAEPEKPKELVGAEQMPLFG